MIDKIKLFMVYCLSNQLWGVSSAGRAPALHAGGHRFDPDTLHHDNNSRTSYLNREVRLFSNLQLKQNLIGAITVISLYMAPFSIYMNAELEV